MLGIIVLLTLILTPLILVPAFLVVDPTKVVLKRFLGVMAFLSPAPMAWFASSLATRFGDGMCYSEVVLEVLPLTEYYAKQYGEAASQRLEEDLRPYVRGYETSCDELLDQTRQFAKKAGVP